MYREAYLETEILCASPVRLVELLYRGAIEAARSARNAVEENKIAERNRHLTRAQAILAELALSLDHDRGGTLSRELVELYDYMQRRLNEANAVQRREPIDEVCRLLETLLDAWVGLSAQELGGPGIPVMANQGAGQFAGVDFEQSRIDSLG